MDKDLKPLPNDWRELLKQSKENYIRQVGTMTTFVDWVYNDLEELFKDTEPQAVDVDVIKSEALKKLITLKPEDFEDINDYYSYVGIICSTIDHLASRDLIRGAIPDDMVLVPLSLLHKAKVLINFHVRRGACIDIDDKLFNEGDIFGELNKIWINAYSNQTSKGRIG